MADQAGGGGVAAVAPSAVPSRGDPVSDAGCEESSQSFLSIYFHDLAGEALELRTPLTTKADPGELVLEAHPPLPAAQLPTAGPQACEATEQRRQFYVLSVYEVKRTLAQYLSEKSTQLSAADLLEVLKFPMEADQEFLAGDAQFYVETVSKRKEEKSDSARVATRVSNPSHSAADATIEGTASPKVVGVWLSMNPRAEAIAVPVGSEVKKSVALELQYIRKPYPEDFEHYCISLGQDPRAFEENELPDEDQIDRFHLHEHDFRDKFERYWSNDIPVSVDSMEILADLATDHGDRSALLNWASKASASQVLEKLKASTIERLLSACIGETVGPVFWNLIQKKRWDALRRVKVLSEEQWERSFRPPMQSRLHEESMAGLAMFHLLKPRNESQEPGFGRGSDWVKEESDAEHVFRNPDALAALARASAKKPITKEVVCSILARYAAEAASKHCPPDLPELWNQIPGITVGVLLDRIIYEFLAIGARKFGADVFERKATSRDHAIDVSAAAQNIATLVQNVDGLTSYLARTPYLACLWPTCLDELWTRFNHASVGSRVSYFGRKPRSLIRAERDLKQAFEPVREAFDRKLEAKSQEQSKGNPKAAADAMDVEG